MATSERISLRVPPHIMANLKSVADPLGISVGQLVQRILALQYGGKP